MKDTEPILNMIDKSSAIELGKENGILEPIAELNIFRTLLKHPKLASAISNLIGVLLFQNKLEPKLRELIILRTGWIYKCNYEWTHHYDIAKAFKVSEDKILSIRKEQPDSDIFDDLELLIIKAVDELKQNEKLSKDTACNLLASFDGVEDKEQKFLEIMGTMTTWKLISQLLNSLNIQLEDHLKDWPPDGKSL